MRYSAFHHMLSLSQCAASHAVMHHAAWSAHKPPQLNSSPVSVSVWLVPRLVPNRMRPLTYRSVCFHVHIHASTYSCFNHNVLSHHKNCSLARHVFITTLALFVIRACPVASLALYSHAYFVRLTHFLEHSLSTRREFWRSLRCPLILHPWDLVPILSFQHVVSIPTLRCNPGSTACPTIEFCSSFYVDECDAMQFNLYTTVTLPYGKFKIFGCAS